MESISRRFSCTPSTVVSDQVPLSQPAWLRSTIGVFVTTNKVTTPTLLLLRILGDWRAVSRRSWRRAHVFAAAVAFWGMADASAAPAGPAFPGYWTVEAPELVEFEVALFSGVRVHSSPETHIRDICFLGLQPPRVVATCSTALAPTDAGSIDHDEVRLRWAVGPASLLFTGTRDGTGRFVGAFTARSPGVTVTGDIPATLSPLDHSAVTAPSPASADAIAQVLDDLRQDRFERDLYEPNGLRHAKSALAWVDAKAATRQLAFLGRVHVRWRRQKPDVIDDVYEVRSDSHRSLCRIAFSPRGRVTDFACQKIE